MLGCLAISLLHHPLSVRRPNLAGMRPHGGVREASRPCACAMPALTRSCDRPPPLRPTPAR
jgi:hypothetical protein